jgi:hypothetical protein
MALLLHSVTAPEGFCETEKLPLPVAQGQRLSEFSTGLP